MGGIYEMTNNVSETRAFLYPRHLGVAAWV